MLKSHAALIARWDDSLAVRLPADLVKALELRAGDEIELIVDELCGLEARREFDIDDLLQQLRHFRGKLPADFCLSRDETPP
ncbi:AbrB/MazE/SpoVT family DNA-binding domain-containing protein [Burkholderia gladioli]|uniref:AbrB/MazE/SpoVT family DNA-binding domain-containing protein n=1 Tax=Burkholderia gladioli TaxID=28095 RepID=UPI0016410F4D|nr:AbrB/MazE/SpoVT family DNA-binding domain-containing protein [Burkholderia gladioli]